MASFFQEAEAQTVGRIVRTYDSPTLKYTVEKFLMEGEICYLSRIWVQEPSRQIRKATSDWKKNVQIPERIVKKIPGAALAVNGSGFVSPLYPEIPENYPGGSKDYYFCEMIPQDNDRKFLKRLVLIRVDSFGNLRSLNVMLNGVSYENSPNPDSYRNFDIYLGGEFMMRLAAGYFPILAEAFNEDIELYWPRVDGVAEDMIQNEQ